MIWQQYSNDMVGCGNRYGGMGTVVDCAGCDAMIWLAVIGFVIQWGNKIHMVAVYGMAVYGGTIVDCHGGDCV
jgi:hypothetical protein